MLQDLSEEFIDYVQFYRINVDTLTKNFIHTLEKNGFTMYTVPTFVLMDKHFSLLEKAIWRGLDKVKADIRSITSVIL